MRANPHDPPSEVVVHRPVANGRGVVGADGWGWGVKIGRLQVGPYRTSEFYTTSYVVASWSYVTGYWRWAIYWSPPKSLRDCIRLPRFGPSYASGTRYWAGRIMGGHFGAWVDLPLVGCISINTQPPNERMKVRQ